MKKTKKRTKHALIDPRLDYGPPIIVEVDIVRDKLSGPKVFSLTQNGQRIYITQNIVRLLSPCIQRVMQEFKEEKMKSEKENIDSALLHMPPTCGKGTSHIQALTGALAYLQNILSNDDRLSKKLPVELSDAINALKECIALSRQIKTHRVCGLSFIGQTYDLSSNTKMFLLNKDTGWEAMLSDDKLTYNEHDPMVTVAQAKRKEIHDMLDMWMDNNWEFKEKNQ